MEGKFQHGNNKNYHPQKADFQHRCLYGFNGPLNGKKYKGGWFSHKSKAELGSAACEESEKDETGKERFLGGDLTWTLYVNQNDYNFEIALGSCDDPVRPWAQNTNAKN